MTTDAIIDDILAREGGYVDHPADRGGPTNRGITLETLRAWRRRPHRDPTVVNPVVSADDLRDLGEAEARAIYQAQYIDAPGFTSANIPHEAVRVAVIDEGVNGGIGTAMRHLQQAVGVKADGAWGPITRAAVAAADPGALLKELVRLRLLRYARICQADPSQLVFFAGWVNRAFSVL